MQKAIYTLILLVSLSTTTYTSKAQYVFELFDIDPGYSGSYPNNLIVVDTILYFAADDGTNRIGPWTSDGTQSGTKMITDLRSHGTTGMLGKFVSYNGKVFFSANDSIHGFELWVTDGTANGTQMVKDIFTGPPSSMSNPVNFTVVGGKVYFIADDGPHGKELWVTDGTSNGTQMVKDINPGTGNSQPAYFTEYKGKVYFVANDGTHGSELWVTDGTANGTKMVIDLSQGGASGYVYHLTVYNNKLYFAGYYNTKYGLIETDGTANGTKMVKEVAISNQTSLYDIRIVQFNGKMYFMGSDTSSVGAELWVSDGTTNGTNMLKDINPFFGQSSTPEYLTVVGNQLFFTADDGTHKKELWVTDGTVNGTKMVKDLSSNPYSSDPFSLINYGNKLYFGILDSGNTSFYVTDGTGNGTKKIKGYNPITRFNFQGNYIVYNGALYFAGYDTSGYELWKITDTTLNNPPTSIPKTVAGNILIAPNPAHDKVTITLDKEYKEAQVTITDLSGKTILKQPVTATRKHIEVALPDIPTGVYLINLQHSKGVLTERLLIE